MCAVVGVSGSVGRPYPPVRPFATGSVRALTADRANAFDADAIDRVGVPQPVLMENAGRAAAMVLQRLHPSGPVLGLVGAGNNGGDALVALRTLRSWGRDVRAVLVADRAPDDPLLHGWPVDVSVDGSLSDDGWGRTLADAAVVVDGMLGTGARGAPRNRQAAVIERLGAVDVPVLALDVPSGVDATTGETAGAVVRADVTVAFGAPKLGALLHPGRAFVGRHVVVEIGFPPLGSAAEDVLVVTPAWARSRLPARSTDTHKKEVGRVTVVGGQRGMAGAAILAARAAFRAGAGLVRVATAEDNRSALHAALPEAMFVDLADSQAVAEAVASSDGAAVGPGLGADEEGADAVNAALAAGTGALVLDADALNLVAAGAASLDDACARRPVLLTPHPGEMARLMPDAPADRPAAVRAGAARFGCPVLLKGAPSLVSGVDGDVSIDTQSSSDLAVAGMGDVLAGVCASLAAQGLDAATAGRVGLYLSGRAGVIAGRGAALTPSDVIRWVGQARTEEGEAESDLDLPFVAFDADPAR